MADNPAASIGTKTLSDLTRLVLSDDLKALLPKVEDDEKGTVEYHMYLQTLLLVEICSSLNVLKDSVAEVK
jgi:hypothetical protein